MAVVPQEMAVVYEEAVHELQETAVVYEEDVHEPLEMAVVPQDTAVVYEEAVHEDQAQNTDDIMYANTETLENDMDNRYGPRRNHYNLRPCCKPTSNNLS